QTSLNIALERIEQLESQAVSQTQDAEEKSGSDSHPRKNSSDSLEEILNGLPHDDPKEDPKIAEYLATIHNQDIEIKRLGELFQQTSQQLIALQNKPNSPQIDVSIFNNRI